MKLNLQGKLIIPSLGTLLVLMTISSFFLSHLVIKQLQEDTEDMLYTGNGIMAENVSNTVSGYKQTISSIAENDIFRDYADTIRQKQDADPYLFENVKNLLVSLPGSHPDFIQYNLADSEGQIIASSNPKSSTNVNIATREYFAEAIQGKTVFSRPIISKSIGKKAMIVATPLKDNNGTTRGVLYGIMLSSNFTKRTVSNVKIGKTGYSYLIDSRTGLIAAHANEQEIAERNMFKTESWIRDIAPNTGIVRIMTYPQGDKRIVAVYNVQDAQIICVSVLNENELEEQVSYIRNVTLAIMLGCALIVAFTLFFIIRMMVKDVQTTNVFAHDVAKGKLDSVLSVNRSDELGSLGDALRLMVDSLKTMIKKSEEESKRAHEEAIKAKEATEKAYEQERLVEKSQEHLLSIADRLEKMAQQISSASTELAAQIEQSDKTATESAARLDEAASAMNEMNSTVQEVASNSSSAAIASEETHSEAFHGAEIVRQAITSITTTREATLALQQNMHELNEQAQNISKIMGVISDIADQTNLLALNAAIEAARAGEAGRGFAVVADEVRKLAEKTMSSTSDVAKVTKSIQTSVDKSMTAMNEAASRLEEATGFVEQSGDALQGIVTKVENTADQVHAIATAAEEQSAASNEINKSISDVNTLSAQNAQTMDEATQAVNVLAEQMELLKELMHEMHHK